MSESRPESYWPHLYWLTVLEEQKSYTRAAEKLGISKSAISQKISELERVTGKTLVHRTTRSVSLSDDGLRLVAELNEPFGQLRDIFTGACDEGGPLRGTLRLTAPVAFSRQQLVPAIAPFLHQHPQLHLQLEVTDRLVSLASEGFDLAIRHCRREALPDTHVAWPLCHTATLTVASADYIRRHGRPETPEDLRHHQCLTYPRGPQRPQWTFASRQSPDARVTINVRGHSPPITASRYVMQCWRGLGWRCCRISAPGRPLAAGWCRSCCRRGSRWRCLPIGCTSSGPIPRACRARWKPSAAT